MGMKKKWLALGLPGDEERRYRQAHRSAEARQTAVGIGILCLALLAYLYNDYLFFGYSLPFAGLLTLRLVLAASGLVLIHRLRAGIGDYRLNDRLILLLFLAGIVATVLIGLSRPRDYQAAAVIDVLIVFAFYFVLPFHLLQRLGLATLLALAEITILLTVRVPPNRMTAYAIIIGFLAANFMGFAVSGLLEAARRREFRAWEKEAAVREELRRLAFRDELTGIANRRFFLDRAEAELVRFRRYGKSFGFVMLDLDRFKSVNDRFGHLAGDRVLREVVRTILGEIRETDLLGRLGGEEFGLLLPETGERETREVAERIRRALAERAIEPEGGGPVTVTASMGLSTAQPGDTALDDLLARADGALLGAKDGGRNRFRVASREVDDTGERHAG